MNPWRASAMTAREEPSVPHLPPLGETPSHAHYASSKPGPTKPFEPPSPGLPRQGGPPGPPGPPADNGLYQPRTLKFWLTLLSNFMAMFLVALDRTILATAIPTITDEFHSLGDIGWYGSAYMLTTACSQLIYGRLYKHYNMKWSDAHFAATIWFYGIALTPFDSRVFLTSVVVFEVGSTICGAAPSSPVFITGRAVAGLGSAGIFSGAMMIMIPMVPLHKRPMFQSMFGMIFGLASVLGPLVGGAFTSGVSWR